MGRPKPGCVSVVICDFNGFMIDTGPPFDFIICRSTRQEPALPGNLDRPFGLGIVKRQIHLICL